MPSDKLTFLEQLSNALAGQSATSGAKALGEGIGYGFSGGALSDIPDVMREAIESHREKSAMPQSKPKQDALELASALAAMSNPVSLAGHAVDFAGAVPSMIQQKLSGEPLPTSEVMQSGLKRRLAKGGAAAEYALKQRASRIDDAIGSEYMRGGQKASRMGLEGPLGGYGDGMSQSAMRAMERTDRQSLPAEYFNPEMQQFINYLDKKKLNAPMEYHHVDQGATKAKMTPFYEPKMIEQIKEAMPEVFDKSQKTKRPKAEPFAEIATEARQAKPQYQMQIDKAKFNKLMNQEPELFAQWKQLRDEADLARRQGQIDAANQIDRQKNQLVKAMTLSSEEVKALRQP
jgi:hypothetical protein